MCGQYQRYIERKSRQCRLYMMDARRITVYHQSICDGFNSAPSRVTQVKNPGSENVCYFRSSIWNLTFLDTATSI